MLLQVEDTTVLRAAECAALFERGELRVDGSQLVPLAYLWFRASDVHDHMLRNLAGDFEVVKSGAESFGRRNGHMPESYELRLRCRHDLYEIRRHGEYVRYPKVDRIFTRWGLLIHELGAPLFATSPRCEPVTVAA